MLIKDTESYYIINNCFLDINKINVPYMDFLLKKKENLDDNDKFIEFIRWELNENSKQINLKVFINTETGSEIICGILCKNTYWSVKELSIYDVEREF